MSPNSQHGNIINTPIYNGSGITTNLVIRDWLMEGEKKERRRGGGEEREERDVGWMRWMKWLIRGMCGGEVMVYISLDHLLK